MILSIFACFIIIGRAYLHFQGLVAYAIALDLSSLVVFLFLIAAKKERIYLGIVAYLPSVSLYLFIQQNAISDLSLVSLLLTACVLFHVKKNVIVHKEGPVIVFLIMYALLLFAYLFSNYINVYLELKLQPVFLRFLNYLLLTLYASFTFWLVYRKEDNDKIADAFLVAAWAYLISSVMGYFYLENLDMAEYAGDITKELFRYPGFSNSNYIGNVILLMAAIAYSIKRKHFFAYAAIIVLTALLAQSRSVLISGMVFLFYCAAQALLNNRIDFRVIVKNSLIALCLLGALFLLILQDDKVQNIATQYMERVLLQSATDNIAERVSAIRTSIHDVTGSPKNLLFGLGYVQDGVANPHNSIVQSLLLFGLVQTAVLAAYFLYLIWKVPIVLFAIAASLAEILFFTFSYDFLFFILVAVNVYKPAQTYSAPAAGRSIV